MRQPHSRQALTSQHGRQPESEQDTAPWLVSATVNPTGTELALQFDQAITLFASLPSLFAVTADGTAVSRSTTATQLSSLSDPANGRLGLSLSPAVERGQTVVVTYTDLTPGDDVNVVEDTAGNDAASFTTGMDGVRCGDQQLGSRDGHDGAGAEQRGGQPGRRHADRDVQRGLRGALGRGDADRVLHGAGGPLRRHGRCLDGHGQRERFQSVRRRPRPEPGHDRRARRGGGPDLQRPHDGRRRERDRGWGGQRTGQLHDRHRRRGHGDQQFGGRVCQ